MSEVTLHPRLEALLGYRDAVAADIDRPLLTTIIAIVALGLVMMASASVGVAEQAGGGSMHYLQRQLLFLVPAVAAFAIGLRLPLDILESLAGPLLMFGLFLLVLVLIPGVGREANGAVRWIPLGPVNVQASEVARLFLLIYFAAFLQRHGATLRRSARPLLPGLLVLGVAAVLLLAQPDFGALAVLVATIGGLFFIAGMPLLLFIGLAAVAGIAGALLIFSSPYRLERLTAFRDPWADPFDTGFQLTQSLIAVGRGEWFGVGLGNSVQKLFYLPEAHTDFLFAVLAEELGLVGMMVVIALYAFLVWRACRIGATSLRAGRHFGGLLAYGIGIGLGLQAFVNMGVNLGLLPTKGLTLPLMSYGGSSLVMSAAALGLLMRVDLECRRAGRSASARPQRRPS
ncbi:putative lipid II flippase FtsW [Spiribacter sp. 221]|uniref:putative lipid II flippase FtsW n=1 Tax=Spiribacter onubensis TaxID=3122420 RepID=UPI00349FB40C